MAAAVPALLAPAVVLPATQDIAWELDDVLGNTGDQNAQGRGNEHLVEFNTDQPPLRKPLPGLPWQTTPGHPQVRLLRGFL